MRIRNTRQLEVIREVVRGAGRPLAIPELHAMAREVLPQLGLATVYRAVATLAQGSVIVSLNYAGQPVRYEWAVARHHSHFICNSCKRVYDIEAPEKVPLPKRRPEGFRFEGDEVVYFGVCAECVGKR